MKKLILILSLVLSGCTEPQHGRIINKFNQVLMGSLYYYVVIDSCGYTRRIMVSDDFYHNLKIGDSL